MENNLPKIFENFSEARKQGFIAMKNLKDSGKKVAGTFCTYTPVELFMAANMCHVGLCSTSDETIPDAEAVLPRNLCPLIKSSYGFAITDKCPYMYFSDIVVGETTCDGKKKMYELLSDIKNVHVMKLPNSQDDELSKELWYNEILLLKKRLEDDFNIKITDDDIKKAIKERNKERRILKEFYELSTLTPPPMTGLEQLQVLFGSQFKFSHEEKMSAIQTAIDKIKSEYEDGTRKVSESQKRIVITGCPMGGVTEKVVKIIEEVGGVVVAFENCTGAKQIDELVDENEEPYQAIAKRYLNIGCSVMTPDENRYKLLEKLTKQFKADAIIEMTLQACHTYNVETYKIQKLADKLSTPFFSVETDYSTSDIAQLKTRIAAFIETL